MYSTDVFYFIRFVKMKIIYNYLKLFKYFNNINSVARATYNSTIH